MKYAHGVILGFLLTSVAFIGSTVIQLLGLGVTDQAILSGLWMLFVIWSVISFILVLLPPLTYRIIQREEFRRVMMLEFGSVMFFTPIWMLVSIEFSGIEGGIGILLTSGIGGIPFPGLGGSVAGMSMGPIFSFLILVGLFLIGGFLIRPSFVDSHKTPTLHAPRDDESDVAVTKYVVVSGTDTIADEMPEISRPVPDESSVEELKRLLYELEVPESIVNRILSAGFATVTDLVAAKPDHLAAAAGVDVKGAEDLLLDIQKKVWFGGI
ncbi:MAG: helix-hairpin-helix domain-containing protein [Candidatus Thorarchaeota archaeon]